MKISQQSRPPAHVVTINGRLDAYTSKVLEEHLTETLRNPAVRYLILDVANLEYLSSAGIRVIIAANKQLLHAGGGLFLIGLTGYPEKVITMAGFADALPRYNNLALALAAAGAEASVSADWDKAETFAGKAGAFKIVRWSSDQCEARALGDVRDVLHCRVTPELMRSKSFSATEYSLGLGGLGDKLDDYFPILGEMITIGGTMVWLPTDGHDTADYLIPQTDTGEVTIRTAFNVSLGGEFNDLLMFESPSTEGSSIGEIYRDCFALAQQRHQPFKGGIFLVMRAEVRAAYGAGVVRSPILPNCPANGKLLTDPENFEEWFEVDHNPRHRDVTGLFSGFGLSMHSQFAHYYDHTLLDKAFYINPGNHTAATDDQMLHNHGVFFNPQPFNDRAQSLEEEIRVVVENGDFRDMRHVFDNTRLTRALIGLAYIEQFAPDDAGGPA